MPSTESLAPFASSDPRDFEELRQTCLKIIRAWIAADGEPWDDLVHDFFLIDAQGDDVAADPEVGRRKKLTSSEPSTQYSLRREMPSLV